MFVECYIKNKKFILQSFYLFLTVKIKKNPAKSLFSPHCSPRFKDSATPHQTNLMPNVADNLSTKMASALFTIEQIELIRRLRNSGITKEQVSMAFDQMDRLEVELGSKQPSSSSRNNNNNNLHYPTICSTLDHDPPPHSATNGVSKSSAEFFKDFSRPHSSSNSSTDGAATDGTANGDLSPHTANHSPTSRLSASGELTIVPLTGASSPSSGVPPNVPVSYSPADGVHSQQSYGGGGRSQDGGASANCVPIQCLVNPLDLLQDECYELDELKKLVSSFSLLCSRISQSSSSRL